MFWCRVWWVIIDCLLWRVFLWSCYLAWSNFALLHSRCSSSISDYSKDLHTSFSHQLSQQEIPLPVLYGMVLSLCHLGGKASDGCCEWMPCIYCSPLNFSLQSIGETLLPRVAHFSDYIQWLFESSLPSGQQNALRVYSALLVSWGPCGMALGCHDHVFRIWFLCKGLFCTGPMLI